MPHKSAPALRVSLADKLHNARSIVADLRQHGPALWSRFTGTAEQTGGTTSP
jgi:(p)ppGpp synthase/HD superfamily hydrolase